MMIRFLRLFIGFVGKNGASERRSWINGSLLTTFSILHQSINPPIQISRINWQYKRLLMFAIIASLTLGTFSCQSPTDENNTGNLVTLNGAVLNNDTGLPIANAVVRLLDIEPSEITLSDSLGQYHIEFEVSDSREVKVAAFKESYVADTTEALAVPGRVVQVSLLKLSPTSSTPSNSGNAKSLYLYSQSAVGIGIITAGDPEVAQLVFEIVDSTGAPVDLEHSEVVHFAVLAGPGGGEYVTPDSAMTNNDGKVEVQLFSGFKAGVVQVQAGIPGTGIESNPISIVIHGGYPHINHFSVASNRLNFPGLVYINLENPIIALVGDKFSNPVRPGTAVYFKSDGGIIGAADTTDENGYAGVILRSGLPHPVHPTLGPGFATITAQTIDENQDSINVETLVLFSGYPAISINPNSGFTIPDGGSKAFVYTVSDQNDNPLAESNTISVEIEGEGIETSGDLSIDLPDTQSPAWTSFSFTVTEVSDSNYVRPVTIKVKSTGENGIASLTITGSAGN